MLQNNKNLFHHESLQDKNTIRKLLEAVTQGLEKGELHFSDGGNEIIMKPEGLLHLKVSGSKEDGRNRLTVRVTWHDDLDKKTSKRSLSVNGKMKVKE